MTPAPNPYKTAHGMLSDHVPDYVQLSDDEDEDDDDANLVALANASAAGGRVRRHHHSSALPDTSNLDHFYTLLYAYYHEYGYWAIAAKSGMAILTSLFSIVTIATVYACVDVRRIFGCRDYDNPECRQVFVCTWPTMSGGGSWLATLAALWFIYFLVCNGVYWAWQSLSLLWSIGGTGTMGNFYRDVLRISDEKLRVLDRGWFDVTERLARLQQRGRLPLLPGQAATMMITEPVTDRAAANRIMRYDNLLIALLASNVLELRAWQLSQALLSHVQRSVLQAMLDPRTGRLDATLLDHVGRLRARLRRLALCNLLLLPVTVVSVVLQLFFTHFDDFYNKRDVPGSRRWTLYAQWRLRQMNELPHVFEQRLRKAAALGTVLLRHYASHWWSHVCYGLGLMVVCVFSVLAVLYHIVDTIVFIETKILGISLASLLTALAILVGLTRSGVLDANATTRASAVDLKKLCDRLRTTLCMTVMPAHAHAAHNAQQHAQHGVDGMVSVMADSMADISQRYEYVFSTKQQLEQLYRSRFETIGIELLGVVLVPYMLWWHLPQRMHACTVFVREQVTRDPELQDVVHVALQTAPPGAPPLAAMDGSSAEDRKVARPVTTTTTTTSHGDEQDGDGLAESLLVSESGDLLRQPLSQVLHDPTLS